MRIVLTGSLGNIGRPLAKQLKKNGHAVTVISSKAERQAEIEALGATAAIGTIEDPGFLTKTFNGADIVYLMETMEAVGDVFDKELDFIDTITGIGRNYKQAVEAAGVKQVVHLSSIGAHIDKGNGILAFHYNVESVLRQLPDDVAIKFMRPVGFYTNMYAFIRTIKAQGAIVQNYGGDKKEPWVALPDIVSVIAEEMDKPFNGKTVRYIASDELSPDEIASALGRAIGQPDLKWTVIPDEQLLNSWLAAGMNEQVARGFVELQASQGTGALYEDYYHNRPILGNVKLKDFAAQFAAMYNKE